MQFQWSIKLDCFATIAPHPGWYVDICGGGGIFLQSSRERRDARRSNVKHVQVVQYRSAVELPKSLQFFSLSVENAELKNAEDGNFSTILVCVVRQREWSVSVKRSYSISNFIEHILSERGLLYSKNRRNFALQNNFCFELEGGSFSHIQLLVLSFLPMQRLAQLERSIHHRRALRNLSLPGWKCEERENDFPRILSHRLPVPWNAFFMRGFILQTWRRIRSRVSRLVFGVEVTISTTGRCSYLALLIRLSEFIWNSMSNTKRKFSDFIFSWLFRWSHAGHCDFISSK